MLKRNLISFSALSGFVFLALGSTPGFIEQIQQAATGGGGSGAGNVAACESWVAHSNSLPCYPVDFDASEMCPPSLDMTPIDMASYYECMVEGSRCNGAIPDMADAGNCSVPTN
ncbi:MAG: hypothetical protein ACI8RZ_007310 [Myxococcota bacterium]|jgi:hypothetical protein